MKVVRRKLNESTNNNIVKLWMVTVFEMLQEMSNGQDISVYEDELTKHLENEYPADFYVECVGEEIAIYDQSNDGVIYCTPNAVEVEGKLYYELLNDVKYLKTLYRKYNTSVKDNFMSKLYSMLDNRNMRESVKFTRKNKKMNEESLRKNIYSREGVYAKCDNDIIKRNELEKTGYWDKRCTYNNPHYIALKYAVGPEKLLDLLWEELGPDMLSILYGANPGLRYKISEEDIKNVIDAYNR